jgi:hypothetical protein
VVTHLDHLVVAARTLDEGLAWCEATLGIVPTAGGRHDFMGTHNRVFSIATAAWPLTYLEIIAIDPQAPAPGRPRWFALDGFDGPPRLLHWVARCADVDAARRSAIDAGQPDPGPVVDAARGTLRWRITVPDDGALVAPTLIEWASPHPVLSMPASGVELRAFEPHPLTARLHTPRGPVTLTSR